MRKTKRIILFALASLMLLMSLTACSVMHTKPIDESSDQQAHEHVFSESIIANATCEEEGSITSTCRVCGEERLKS